MTGPEVCADTVVEPGGPDVVASSVVAPSVVPAPEVLADIVVGADGPDVEGPADAVVVTPQVRTEVHYTQGNCGQYWIYIRPVKKRHGLHSCRGFSPM